MNEKKHHHSQAQEAPGQMPETPEEAIPAEEIAEEELPAEECAEQAAQPSPEDALKAALS